MKACLMNKSLLAGSMGVYKVNQIFKTKLKSCTNKNNFDYFHAYYADTLI